MNDLKPNVDAMEQRLMRGVETSTLCGFYGALLTDKQREALSLHYEEDWSLGEIAERFGVSRQNVHELIIRSEDKLRRYEQKLGCVERSRETATRLNRALEAIDTLEPCSAHETLSRVRDEITAVLRLGEGEDDEHGI